MTAFPEQLAFPDIQVPELPREATILERFEAWHALNPHVYVELRRLALDMVRRGSTRLSISMLTEVLRWSALQTRPDAQGYKINNDFRALFARMLSDNEPELAGRFELRARRSA